MGTTKTGWIYLIGIAVLLAIVVLLFKKCEKDPGVIVTQPIPDSVFYWKNKYDETIASQKGLPEQFALVRKDIIEQLSKEFNTKLSKIQAYQVINFNSIDTIPPKPGSDTNEYFPPVGNCPPQIKSMMDIFENPWYTATVRLGENKFLKLENRDTATIVWKEVTEGGLFNRKNFLQVDVKFADPSRKTVSMQNYRKLQQPEKQLSLNIEGRAIYFNNQFVPMAGIGLQRSSDRFLIGVSGGKEFYTNSYYGEAHVGFKLLKFK